MTIEVLKTDITSLAVHAIANAANEMMLGGRVDGAIRRAAFVLPTYRRLTG